MSEKRRICAVVASRANYARIKSALLSLSQSPSVELQIVVTASALLPRYGYLPEIIAKDGLTISANVHMIIEGSTPSTMAKSTGLGIIELSSQFERMRPNFVLTVADRFETMASAIAASYMNIPLAHTQGGDITGSIDESVRHSITKLSHIHFPATKLSYDRLLRMGEQPSAVFMTGCPSIDLLVKVPKQLTPRFFETIQGVGASIDPTAPYLVVLQHPVTTEYEDSRGQIEATISAVEATGLQTVWLWPNIDAGADEMSKSLRRFRESETTKRFFFIKNISPEAYAELIAHSACLVGNSSSALREGAFLGVPAVNIGTRQNGRERAGNVLSVPHNREEILLAIKKQVRNGRYDSSPLFGEGNAGKKIADVLATIDIPSVQKRMTF